LAYSISREVSLQIQTELHSVHGPLTNTAATDATLTYTPPCELADEVMTLLNAELEKMAIETQLRKEGGPIRSAVEGAIKKRRQAEKSGHGVLSPEPSPPPPKLPPNAITDFRTWSPPKDAPTPSKHAMRMAALSTDSVRGRSRSC